MSPLLLTFIDYIVAKLSCHFCGDVLSGEVSLLGGHEDGDDSHQMPCPV